MLVENTFWKKLGFPKRVGVLCEVENFRLACRTGTSQCRETHGKPHQFVFFLSKQYSCQTGVVFNTFVVVSCCAGSCGPHQSRFLCPHRLLIPHVADKFWTKRVRSSFPLLQSYELFRAHGIQWTWSEVLSFRETFVNAHICHKCWGKEKNPVEDNKRQTNTVPVELFTWTQFWTELRAESKTTRNYTDERNTSEHQLLCTNESKKHPG